MNSLRPRHASFPLSALTRPRTAAAASAAAPAPASPPPVITITSPRPEPCREDLTSSFAARGVGLDPLAVPSLLRACASLGASSLARNLHQQAVVFGYHQDAHISSSLIHMYGKLDDAESARRVFDGMLARNAIPWSAVIGAYSQVGDVGMSFTMYGRMRREGIVPNSVTVLGLLSGIRELRRLHCLHGSVIRNGLGLDPAVANCMTNVYLKCESVDSAFRLFDSMTRRDVISWNTMLSGYAQEGDIKGAVDLFKRMRVCEVHPDHQTFASLISAVTNSSTGSTFLGESIHGQIVTLGFDMDKHVQTSLVVLYLKLRNVNCAFFLFDQALHKDAVFWTAIISGLVQNERAHDALHLFQQMLRVGETSVTTTIPSVLAACAQLGSLKLGASVHGYLIRRQIILDVASENSLVSMYAKCSCHKQCQHVFDMIQSKDIISWNAIVAGYAQNGHIEKAFHFFNKMRDACLRPDSITVISLLKASASLGTLHHGRCIHGFIFRNQLSPTVSITTSLIDMYSKCGYLNYAQSCFIAMQEQDLILWSAIIASYGNHGKGDIALRLFLDFLNTGIEPNHVIFLSVLNACSHAGFVSHGVRIFQSMVDDFRISPHLEHYACVIDLLGRSGMLQEAVMFIRAMSHKPNADVLGILLDACRIHRNMNLGEEIAREIIALKPETAGNFIQLAHSYATMNRWDDVGESWMRMRSLGLKKTPGWSFIELNGIVTTFFVGHISHPHLEELTALMAILEKDMRKSSPETDVYKAFLEC